MSNIPITPGTGAASVATETVGGLNFQQIEVYGGGGASVLGINPDRSINASIIGIPTVLIGGSVTTIGTAAANQSVSGAVQLAGASPASLVGVQRLDIQVTGSTLGLVAHAVLHGLTSAGGGGYVDVKVDPSGALVTTASSVIAYQAPASIMAVGGTIGASVIGTAPVNLVQISGQSPLLAGQALGVSTTNTSVITVFQSSSLIAVASGNQSVSGAINVSGSVLLGSSNASVIATLQSSSIIAINAGSVVGIIPGSVITVNQAQSIVGTYAEDAAHTTGDKGLFVMQVRNDTMSSMTSADGDYSPVAGGPMGETIIANSPITKWVQGTADFRQGNTGASIVAIAAGGSSIFTYITGVQVANMGSASVLVTLASGGSTLGYTIAPAGGGSNIVYPNALKTPANFGFAASLSGIASVLVSAQGFISKT